MTEPYHWFDDKADAVRAGAESEAGPSGITLPGFTQTDATPFGHPGFVTEGGGWLDLTVDPTDTPGGIRLALGRGTTGDNTVEIDANNTTTPGVQVGLFGIYTAEPTFTYEADYSGSATCSEDPAFGGSANLDVQALGPSGNVAIDGTVRSNNAEASAALRVIGTNAQTDALLVAGTVDANESMFEVHANGDVEVFTPGGLVLRDSDGVRHRLSTGGVFLHSLAFSHSTAGLLTGADLGFAPAIGDVLLDAWIEVVTAWDGTTPMADFGQLLSGDTAGCFSYEGGAVNLLVVESANGNFMPHGLACGGSTSLGLYQGMVQAGSGERSLPARFTSGANLKVVVSQNGQANGGSAGSTTGEAILHVLIATPSAPT